MSNVVSKGACDSCESSDGNVTYDDGHSYCFVCASYTHGDEKYESPKEVVSLLGDIEVGDPTEIHKRKISLSTAQFFGYSIGKRFGKHAQFAPYYTKDGELAAYHIKYMKNGKKAFSWVSGEGIEIQDLMPFGWQRIRGRGGRMVVVTEGEIDAMSMSQVQSNEYPVVSIPTGAGPQVQKYLAHHKDWFNQFDKVVLMFDNDQVGKDAARAGAQVIGAKAVIADLPLNDPNEMLMQDMGKEMLSCMWNAQPYHPEEIITLASLREEMKKPVEHGLSYPYEDWTRLTHGIRLCEITTIGAGVGAGKSDLEAEIALHLAHVHNQKVGLFFLEQQPKETGLRLAGKVAGKRFHIPNDPEVPKQSDWKPEELEEAFEELVENDNIFLYSSFGINEWENVKAHIEYLRWTQGVRYFFIDHITLLSEAHSNTKEILQTMLAEMAGMVVSMEAHFFLVSHLASPESGLSHEEGGRVTARQFKNSRAIATYSHYMIGIERDQQAEDPAERSKVIWRFLKDRKTGEATGKVIAGDYDVRTGRLVEMGEVVWERKSPPKPVEFGKDAADLEEEEWVGGTLVEV